MNFGNQFGGEFRYFAKSIFEMIARTTSLADSITRSDITAPSSELDTLKTSIQSITFSASGAFICP